MVAEFDKEKFLSLLGKRPTLVRKLVNPSEDFLIETVKKNDNCLQHLPMNLRSKALCDALIKHMLGKSYGYNVESIAACPEEYRKSMPASMKNRLLEKNGSLVKYLFCEYAEWIECANNVEWDDIPSEFRTPDMIVAHIDKGSYRMTDIPDSLWTPETQELVFKGFPEGVAHLRIDLLDQRGLRAAFKTDPTLNIFNSHLKDWKRWTQELAELVTAGGQNLDILPDKFKTRDMCLRCCKVNGDYILDTPAKFNDREMCLAATVATSWQTWKSAFSNKADFQVEVARSIAALELDDKGDRFRDAVKHLDSIGQDTWLKIVEALPAAIRAIEKQHQTKEMVTAAIKGLSIESVGEYLKNNWINRTRITKDLAPYLAGSESATVQELMSRKLNPTKPRRLNDTVPAVVTTNKPTVTVEMTPGELNDLRNA